MSSQFIALRKAPQYCLP